MPQDVLKQGVGIPKAKLSEILSSLLSQEFELRTKQKAEPHVLTSATEDMVNQIWANRNALLTKIRTAKWRSLKPKSDENQLSQQTPEPKIKLQILERSPLVDKNEAKPKPLRNETQDIRVAKFIPTSWTHTPSKGMFFIF